MSKNDNNQMNEDEVLNVGERIFKRTRLGLAEEEVRSYVEELIDQRDALIKKQEHLAALTELAEKTVIEANNLSQLMMKKSTEQAKIEADKIRVKAEQDGEQLIQTKKAEAKVAAEKEAEDIKAEAHRHAKVVREERLDSVKAEAAGLAQKLQGELLANIDNIRKQVMTLGSKFGDVSPSVATQTTEKPEDIITEGENSVLLDHIPWLEVEVLPPLDIEKIMDLIARLENLPEVKTTDLLPETPNPLIRVFLNEPSPLAEMLKTLPQVEKVTQITDEDDMEIQSDDRRERIQIVLGQNPGNNAETREDSKVKAN